MLERIFAPSYPILQLPWDAYATSARRARKRIFVWAFAGQLPPGCIPYLRLVVALGRMLLGNFLRVRQKEIDGAAPERGLAAPSPLRRMSAEEYQLYR